MLLAAEPFCVVVGSLAPHSLSLTHFDMEEGIGRGKVGKIMR